MATNPSIPAARVYADALLDIGREQDLVPRINDELEFLLKLYQEDRDFRAFFTSPRLDPDEKFRILEVALGEELSKPVLGLLSVMIRKGREVLLDNVALQFRSLQDALEGRIHVDIRSARPLDEDQREKIRSLISESSKMKVEIHERVEPGLIGGMIVRRGDYVIDGSLRRKMQALRKQMVAKEKLFE